MDAATERMLAKSPLLKGLRKEAVGRLLAKATLLELPRKAVVWCAGAPATGVGVVRSGVLRESIGAEGRELLLRFPTRGDVIGEGPWLEVVPHHTEMVAHEAAVVVWLPAAALDPLVAHDGAMAKRLSAIAVARRRRLEERLADTAYLTVEARLAGMLADLAATFGVRDSRGVIVNLRVTHRDLAALAGTSRETASVVIGRWQHGGLLETESRRLVVLDPERLSAIAGRSPPE